MTSQSNEYLVCYGQTGSLGRFAFDRGDLSHGQAVIIQSARGLEWGTILNQTPMALAQKIDPVRTGEIVRIVTVEDERQREDQRQQAERILNAAQERLTAEQFPVTLIDAELLFDQQLLILQGIHWGECDLTPLLDSLSQEFQVPILLHDLTTTETPSTAAGTSNGEGEGAVAGATSGAGCGKPGCGSSGGGCGSCGDEKSGCSTGSCSRGKVKTADDLTAYFRGLRSQMESQERRIPLATEAPGTDVPRST